MWASIRARTIGAVVFVTCFGSAHRGDAFVPYRTAGGAAFHWSQTCVPLRAYLDGFPGLTAIEVQDAVAEAVGAWSSGANACSFLTLQAEQGTGPGPFEALDGVNAITFQTTTWCHRDPASGTCPFQDYDPATAAVTSVYVSSSTGQILEADIELNAKDFVWGDLVAHPAVAADLQDVLAHELGHFIGLDNSCWATPQLTPPLDNEGNPAPACATASAAVRETTMFAAAPLGDTSQRTLAPDDVDGLCATYPRAVGPQTSDGAPPTDADMCASSTDGGSAPGVDARDAPTEDVATHDAPARETPTSDAPTRADTPEDRPHAAPESGIDASDAAPDASLRAEGKAGGCGCVLGDGTSGVGASVLLAALALAARRRRDAR